MLSRRARKDSYLSSFKAVDLISFSKVNKRRYYDGIYSVGRNKNDLNANPLSKVLSDISFRGRNFVLVMSYHIACSVLSKPFAPLPPPIEMWQCGGNNGCKQLVL